MRCTVKFNFGTCESFHAFKEMLHARPTAEKWAVSWPGKETEREHRSPLEWRSSGALPACFVVRQARYRPPARRVWFDWNTTVPQPPNGLALFIIVISCLSVSIAGHKNAWQISNIMMANLPFNGLAKFMWQRQQRTNTAFMKSGKYELRPAVKKLYQLRPKISVSRVSFASRVFNPKRDELRPAVNKELYQLLRKIWVYKMSNNFLTQFYCTLYTIACTHTELLNDIENTVVISCYCLMLKPY
jgi:hypothetical protein